MQILGLHFDQPYLRCAAIEIKRNKLIIQSLKTQTADVKPLYISEWKGPIATGLYALVRHLGFKISSLKLIELGLPFQIETLTHLSLEELMYAAQTKVHKTGADSTVFLASKESLKNLLQKCSDLSIEPDLVTATPEALLRFSQYRYPTLQSAFIIHLGSQEWSCLWMEEGKLKKSFTIQGGVESLLFALWEDRKKVLFPKEIKGVAKQIDLLQLKPLLNPKLSDELIELRNKLGATLYTFQQSAGAKPVVFTGRIDAFGNLSKYLLEIAPELTLFETPMPLNVEESKHAIAIGFALALSNKQSKEVQFLKGPFTTRKTWRKRGFWAIALTVASLLFSGAIAYFGNRYFLEIRQSMAAVLKKTIEKTDPKLGANLLDKGLDETFRTIQKYDVESPYLLTAPTVSEVLSWISNYADPLEILDIHYHLISMPRIGSLRDPYTAKVELEFRANSPISARKVHEKLLQGDPLVDSTQEITWETLTDSYRTSFYLKNRHFQ